MSISKEFIDCILKIKNYHSIVYCNSRGRPDEEVYTLENVAIDKSADPPIPTIKIRDCQRELEKKHNIINIISERAPLAPEIWRAGGIFGGEFLADVITKNKNNDTIDIYADNSRAINKITDLLNNVSGSLISKKSSNTVIYSINNINYRVFLARHSTIPYIFHRYDVGVEQIACDGSNLYFSELGKFCYEYKCNLLFTIYRRGLDIKKIKKYIAMGFSAGAPYLRLREEWREIKSEYLRLSNITIEDCNVYIHNVDDFDIDVGDTCVAPQDYTYADDDICAMDIFQHNSANTIIISPGDMYIKNTYFYGDFFADTPAIRTNAIRKRHKMALACETIEEKIPYKIESVCSGGDNPIGPNICRNVFEHTSAINNQAAPYQQQGINNGRGAVRDWTSLFNIHCGLERNIDTVIKMAPDWEKY